MAEVDTNFGGGESGASETYPAQCSSLRKNGHVMIKERPCKIVEMSTSKTGKHGHAKVKQYCKTTVCFVMLRPKKKIPEFPNPT